MLILVVLAMAAVVTAPGSRPTRPSAPASSRPAARVPVVTEESLVPEERPILAAMVAGYNERREELLGALVEKVKAARRDGPPAERSQRRDWVQTMRDADRTIAGLKAGTVLLWPKVTERVGSAGLVDAGDGPFTVNEVLSATSFVASDRARARTYLVKGWNVCPVEPGRIVELDRTPLRVVAVETRVSHSTRPVKVWILEPVPATVISAFLARFPKAAVPPTRAPEDAGPQKAHQTRPGRGKDTERAQ